MDPYIFDLDTPLENLDGVPSDLQGMFTQGDNGFTVSDAFQGVARRLNGLASTTESLRKAKATAGQDAGKWRGKYRAVESIFDGADIDLEDADAVSAYVTDLRDRAAKGGKAGKDAAAEIQRVRDEMSKAQAAAVAAKDQDIAARDATIDQLVTGSAISDALASHKVTAGDALKPYLRQHIKTQISEETGLPYAAVMMDDGKSVRYGGDGKPMTVNAFVAGLKERPEFQPFFGKESTGGGGTDPNQSRRPNGHQSERRYDDDTRTPANKIADGLKKLRKG